MKSIKLNELSLIRTDLFAGQTLMPRLTKAVDGALELGFSLAFQITVARKKQQRISTDGGGSLPQNPFDALNGLEVAPDPPADSLFREPCVEPEKTSKRGKKNKNRGHKVSRVAGSQEPLTNAARSFVNYDNRTACKS